MMTMATTTDSKVIHLGLAVFGGGEAFGPFFAVLTLTREKLEWLLTRADLFRNALALDNRLYQMTWFDYSPDFCETNWDDGDEDELIEQIFEDEDYPDEGFVEFPPAKVPEQGNVRFDYCKLIVANALDSRRPGQVDFYWKGCIKHTNEEIATCEIEEERLRELLARF
jgi:hypothetical protein